MENKVTSFNKALGYKDVFVEYDNEGQQPETVRVRAIRAKEALDYAKLLEDDFKRLEFLCGKPAGWAETLSRESHLALLEADNEVNADFFSSWVQHKVRIAERLAPGFREAMIKAASQSPTGSPKPA